MLLRTAHTPDNTWRRSLSKAALAGALLLIAVPVGLGVGVGKNAVGLVQSLGSSVAVAQSVAPSSPPNPAVQVYQQNGESVVNITSLAILPTIGGLAQQPEGIGSGFVVDDQGRIVTNNHVVQDADQLAVTFQDKTTRPGEAARPRPGQRPGSDSSGSSCNRRSGQPV